MEQVNEDTIKLEWCTEDVLEHCEWLNKEQARHVLATCLRQHDCNVGLNWDVIYWIACELYPIQPTKQV